MTHVPAFEQPGAASMDDSRRNMRLLDGRRVQVKDLLDSGLLHAGAVLEFRRPRSGEVHSAEVSPAGRLQLQDGREFAAPSRAAMEAAGLRAIDGWIVWTVAGTSTTLFDLRKALLESATGLTEADDHEALGPESRHAVLKSARAAAEAGTPKRFAVTDLLRLWNAKARGQLVVDRITADLENYSLETDPDFRKVAPDTVVEVVARPSASEDEDVDTSAGPTGADELDVGLTLGNVPSALAGVTAVNPQDSLAKAMTLMRLNDFSQLAVMTSSRSLEGAVTWRSIAKALAHDQEAILSDAMEPAAEHPFDRDLVDVLAQLYENDFVFVRDSVNEISGIVTAADVVRLYGEMATPFFIIGEIDHLLRAFIADGWTIEQVAVVCDPDDERALETSDELTFGDYQRMLEAPERFSALGWPLDRATFVNRLAEVREIRNGVAHFDPDPLDPDAVASLRNFLNLLRDLRAQAVR